MPEEPQNTDEQQPNDPAELNAADADDGTPENVAAEDAAPDNDPIGTDDIEALMEAAENGAADSTSPTPDADGAAESVGQDESVAPAGAEGEMAAIDALEQAAEDLDAVAALADAAADEHTATEPADTDAAPVTPIPHTTAFQPPAFGTGGEASRTAQLDLLDDVELDVKIELGRTEMYIEDVLGLGTGSVVALDKAAGDPVDVFVNERLVARGEVVVLNDNFCVRINDILSPVPELEE
jgi:flagellar motor switch protein FliN/FliY